MPLAGPRTLPLHLRCSLLTECPVGIFGASVGDPRRCLLLALLALLLLLVARGGTSGPCVATGDRLVLAQPRAA